LAIFTALAGCAPIREKKSWRRHRLPILSAAAALGAPNHRSRPMLRAMASAPTHALVAVALGVAFGARRVSAGTVVAGAVCSVLPDLDVIGFDFGIRYGDVLGHRGISHSLLFALGLSLVVTFAGPVSGRRRAWACLYLFFATASHGLLDAMANGGLGVAFFAPFVKQRYFLPFRPIVVSPLSAGGFFSARGLRVLKSEAYWVWLPAIAFALVAWLLRHMGQPSHDSTPRRLGTPLPPRR
jgi:inner membrane protein